MNYGFPVRVFHPEDAPARLTSEQLAEQQKSRRESGRNTPILRFSRFGRLFQFLNVISVDKRPLSSSLARLNIQKLANFGVAMMS